LNALLTNQNDQNLWQAFKLGDEAAFATLYQRYVRTLYAYGKKITGKEEVVKDAVQDLFIELWQRRERLADAESPKFYLFRSLRRRIFNEIFLLHAQHANWELMQEQLLPTTDSAEFEIIQQEQSEDQTETINRWMRDLPARQFEVLSLRYYHNFSYAQIADLLSINEQSVRNLTQRALVKIRKIAIPLAVMIIFLIFKK
jgi:RNA polymerase sigma factor (sigma-70 family)